MPKDPVRDVDVWLEEYKLLKAQSIAQVELGTRQAQYMQVFAAVLTSVVAVLGFASPREGHGGASIFQLAAAADKTIVAVLFILAASIAYTLATDLMKSSHQVLVLRTRMGVVERSINACVQRTASAPPGTVLGYESELMPHLMEKTLFIRGFVSPHFLSALFRILMLLSIATLLAVIVGKLVGGVFAICYAIAVTVAAGTLIGQWIMMCRTDWRGERGSSAVASSSKREGPWMLLINLVAIIGLIAAAARPEIRDELSALARWAYTLGEGPGSPTWQWIGIAIYSLLAGTILPLPSEAPILFAGTLPLALILSASAVGKGLGAVALAAVVSRHRRLIPERAARLLPEIDSSYRGWLVYFSCQALPFFPMRTSTLVLGTTIGGNRSAIAFAGLMCGMATLVRMGLMWLLVHIGSVAITSLRPGAG